MLGTRSIAPLGQHRGAAGIHYRHDIDGLRAIAVLAVIIYHANLGLSGGYIGVDVFFVISGFIITRLLDSLAAKHAASDLIKDFYIRRIRRIAPASFVVVAVTFVVSYFILLPDDLVDLAKAALSQSVFASNVYFWRTTDYFGRATEFKPLIHFWSLAVEEQFYLLYPALFILVSRKRKLAISMLCLCFVISFALSAWSVNYRPWAGFYLLPMRAWELVLGALTYFVSTSRKAFRPWHCELLAYLGMGMVACSLFMFDNTTRFPGVNAALPCFGAAAIVLASSRRVTTLGWILSRRLFTSLGLLSYSLYLWHWPVLVFQNYYYLGSEIDCMQRLAALSVVLLVAIASYRFVEQPVRKMPFFEAPKVVAIGFLVATLLMALLSYATIQQRGFPHRFPREAIEYASAIDSMAFVYDVPLNEAKSQRWPRFGHDTGEAECVVWGDSHAIALIPAIDQVCKTKSVSGVQMTHSQTPPVLNFFRPTQTGLNERTPEFSDAVLEFVEKNRPEYVVLSAVWSFYGDHDAANFARKMESTLRRLASNQTRVAVVLDVARQETVVPLTLSVASRLGRNTSSIGVPHAAHKRERGKIEDMLVELASKIPNVEILDPAEFLVDEVGLWRAERDGVAMYRDRDHLSVEGSLRLTAMFASWFERNSKD